MAYYEINEESARRAHDLMSYRDYGANSTTNEYRAQVDKAEQSLNIVLSKCKTEAQKERAKELFDKYCKTLAFAINEENRIGCMCASIMVAGPSNFPTKKKERQVAAWNSNRENFNKAEYYLNLMKGVYRQGIQSNDPEVLTALKEKLAKLKSIQEFMKGVNAYYRKNHTLDGCTLLTDQQISRIKADMERWGSRKPFASYTLQNNNANIKATEARIKELEEAKASEPVETEYDGFTYVENTDEMRVQFIFDGKPDEETRSLLKYWGFRWAPSQGAWQRQLTSNGKYAAKKVIEILQN